VFSGVASWNTTLIKSSGERMTSLIALVISVAILALTPVSIPTLHSQTMTGMLGLREDGLLRPSVSRNVAVGDCNAAPPLLESAMTWICGRDGLRVRQKLCRGFQLGRKANIEADRVLGDMIRQ
jgi:hypothetical protein